MSYEKGSPAGLCLSKARHLCVFLSDLTTAVVGRQGHEGVGGGSQLGFPQLPRAAAAAVMTAEMMAESAPAVQVTR